MKIASIKKTTESNETTKTVKTSVKKPVAKPTAKKDVMAITVKPVPNMNNPKEVTVYSKEVVTELKKRSSAIRSEMDKLESSFTKIAFNLYWIYNNGSFKALGYDNVYDLAKNEFNIARGTANNFINIVERFGKKTEGKAIEEIDENYKGYKSSQLIVMLGMSADELKKVSAEMSVRDIKGIKKESDIDSDKKSSPDKEEKDIIDVKSEIIDNRTIMITVKDLDDYYKHKDTIETQITRALSVRDKSYHVEIAYTW